MAEPALRHDEREMVHQIHKVWAERETQNEANRVYVGKLLRAARQRVERGDFSESDWWVWYGKNFERSRKDAEKLLAIAKASDPVAAHAQTNEKRRQQYAAKAAPAPAPAPAPSCGKNNPTESTKPKPVLTVVSSPEAQPEPEIDYALAQEILDRIKRCDVATVKYVLVKLRKTYRDAWGLM